MISLGAGIGYAGFESLGTKMENFGGTRSREWDNDYTEINNNGVNHGQNLWDNFKQFYVGLTGGTSRGEENHLNREFAYTATPDISLLFWRNNNLPDWDYWRILRQRADPKFHLSYGGLLWRLSSTSFLSVYSDTKAAQKNGFILRRAPAFAWYFYWFLHKPKTKGLSPYAKGVRGESYNNYFERSGDDGALEAFTEGLGWIIW